MVKKSGRYLVVDVVNQLDSCILKRETCSNYYQISIHILPSQPISSPPSPPEHAWRSFVKLIYNQLLWNSLVQLYSAKTKLLPNLNSQHKRQEVQLTHWGLLQLQLGSPLLKVLQQSLRQASEKRRGWPDCCLQRWGQGRGEWGGDGTRGGGRRRWGHPGLSSD